MGEEWIVDSMSRDGEHAVLAIWRYDKGEANGAPFCYYGAEPVGCTDERARAVAEYALAVLDALDWRWGPVTLTVTVTVPLNLTLPLPLTLTRFTWK